MNLSYLSRKPLNNKLLLRIIAIIAMVGFADAVYLTANYYLGTPVPCLLTGGCDKVLTSTFSSFSGVPLSLLGLLFYATVFVLVTMLEISWKDSTLKVLFGMTVAGFVVSIILLGLQLFVINAICFYCMISLISSTTLFVLAIIIKYHHKRSMISV